MGYLFQDPVPVYDITEPVLYYYTLLIGTVVNVLSVTTVGRLLQTSTVLLTTGLDTVIRVRIDVYIHYWLSMLTFSWVPWKLFTTTCRNSPPYSVDFICKY